MNQEHAEEAAVQTEDAAAAPTVCAKGLELDRGPLTPARLLLLQRRVGNAAVGRLLARSVEPAGRPGARPNLDVGDSGPGVRLLQRLLGVKETGVFDEATRKAVVAFQEDPANDLLPATGGVGPGTWKRLDALADARGAQEGEPGNRPPLDLGSYGPAVKLLQRLLGISESGFFDDATAKAVIAFQKVPENDLLPATGGVGPRTWAKLEARARPPDIEFELEDVYEDPGQPGVFNLNIDPDPMKSIRYIDNRVEAVGWGLYVGAASGSPGSFLVWCRGLSLPMMLPWSLTSFDTSPRIPIGKGDHGDARYGSREEALAAVRAAGEEQRGVGFFPTAGAMLAPTIFTPWTTPRLMATAKHVVDEVVTQVQNELVELAVSIVTMGVLRFMMSRFSRVSPDQPPPRPKPEDEPPPAATNKPPPKPPPTSNPPPPEPTFPPPRPKAPPKPAAEPEGPSGGNPVVTPRPTIKLPPGYSASPPAGQPEAMGHYTYAERPDEIFANGLPAQMSFTDESVGGKAAVARLGIKQTPTHVVVVVNRGQFVPQGRGIVDPHALGNGGAKQWTNPQRVPPSDIVGIQPVDRYGPVGELPPGSGVTR